MDVSEPIGYLLEDELGVGLLQLALPLYKPEQIAASSVLHDHEQMLARLEYLEEPDHIRMLNFFEEVHLLEDFPLAKLVLHVVLFDGLDSHLLAS